MSPPRELFPLSVAPMMDRTDRHFRFAFRALTRRTLLYTEMVTTGAILHGDRDHLLGYDPVEHPVALQLGGDDPAALAECARIAEDMGYDEIDLNVGCPSDRVQKGCFGVVLMKTPEKVAAAVEAMKAVVSVPVTVKHRIGVDDLDRYEDMHAFVTIVNATEPARFTVHARKAWLQGLSPKQNRNVPPLRYEDVYRLKREFPDISIEINGGIKTLDQAAAHLEHVDAVMIGRAAVDDPWIFAKADSRFFGEEDPHATREDAVLSLMPYLEAHVAREGKVHHVTRHLLQLYRGQPGARMWRRMLTEGATKAPYDPAVLTRAVDAVRAAPQRHSAPAAPSDPTPPQPAG